MGGVGRVWVVLVGCGWCWQSVGGVGRVWVVLVECGWC